MLRMAKARGAFEAIDGLLILARNMLRLTQSFGAARRFRRIKQH